MGIYVDQWVMRNIQLLSEEEIQKNRRQRIMKNTKNSIAKKKEKEIPGSGSMIPANSNHEKIVDDSDLFSIPYTTPRSFMNPCNFWEELSANSRRGTSGTLSSLADGESAEIMQESDGIETEFSGVGNEDMQTDEFNLNCHAS